MSKNNTVEIISDFASIIKTAAPPGGALTRAPKIRDLGEPEIIPAPNAPKAESGGIGVGDIAGTVGAAVVTDLAIMGVAKAAGAAGFTFPPLWPAIAVGAALVAAGGAMYGIYTMIEQTDDNVSDLINRMKVLDFENTDVEPAIRAWIDQLTNLRKTFAISPGASDPKEKYEALGNKIAAFERGMTVLGNIYNQYYAEVKGNLKDWFGSWGDKGDFETALKKTTANYKKRLSAMYREFGKTAMQLHNPQEILKEIVQLQEQVEDAWAAPIYDQKEQAALEFARAGGSPDPKQVKIQLPTLMKLRNDLRNKILPQAKRKNKQYSGKRANNIKENMAPKNKCLVGYILSI